VPSSSADAQRLARKIAEGHAWAEHRHEFQELQAQGEFGALILRILTSPSDERALMRGRTAYWDEPSGTLVILSPADPDGGTCFRPDSGRAFFEAAR
jgi:hypothetical protein